MSSQFQSSPGCEAGCNKRFHPDAVEAGAETSPWFQSSPGCEAGCNVEVPLRRYAKPHRCFNPHPAVKPGATFFRRRPGSFECLKKVSILTRL